MKTRIWWAGLAVMGAAITIAWLAPGGQAMGGGGRAAPATAQAPANRLAHFDAIASAARAEREENSRQLPERAFPGYPRHSGR